MIINPEEGQLSWIMNVFTILLDGQFATPHSL